MSTYLEFKDLEFSPIGSGHEHVKKIFDNGQAMVIFRRPLIKKTHTATYNLWCSYNDKFYISVSEKVIDYLLAASQSSNEHYSHKLKHIVKEMTFEQLIFQYHPLSFKPRYASILNAYQDFPNGECIGIQKKIYRGIIIHGECMEEFEVWTSHDDKFHYMRTKEQVRIILKDVQNFKPTK